MAPRKEYPATLEDVDDLEFSPPPRSTPSTRSTQPRTLISPSTYTHSSHIKPSSSSSSSSSRPHHSSPLGRSSLEKDYPAEINFGDDDDDFDDRAGDTLKASSGFKSFRPPSNTTNIKQEKAEPKAPKNTRVVDSTFHGTGHLTKLGTVKRKTPGSKRMLQSKNVAEGKALEGDFELEDDAGPSIRAAPKLKLKVLAPVFGKPDDLDEIGWDEEDDQATLKLNKLNKAQLPPKASNTIRSLDKDPVVIPAPPTESYEDDFADLTDVNFDPAPKPLRLRKRTSNVSAMSDVSTADERQTPSSKSSNRHSTWSTDDNDSSKRFSETSAASITSIATPRDNNSLELYEDDDAEFGLVLDEFGSDRQSLVARLDAKRNLFDNGPKTLFNLGSHRRDGTDDTYSTADQSMEDGLVFDHPTRGPTGRDLQKVKQKRFIRQKNEGNRSKEEQQAREKAREDGWNRPKHPSKEEKIYRPAIGGVSGGHRSHSASTVPSLFENSDSKRRSDSPAGIKPRSSLNIAHRHHPPSTQPSQTPTPVTPHRIRAQRSHANLNNTPSSHLSRKQSLPTLQEDSRPTISPIDELVHPGARASNSTSRLTRDTQSSAMKKRPAVTDNHFFPADRDFADTSSISSISTDASSRQPNAPKYGSQGRSSGTALRGVLHKGNLARESARLGMDKLELDDSPPRRAGPSGPGRPDRPPPSNVSTRISSRDKARMEQQSSNKGSLGKSKGKKVKPILVRREDMGKKGFETSEVTTGSGMVFNRETQTWEGNDAAIRNFERAETPAVRPALITQDSISNTLGGRATSGAASASSWVVGDMRFDPQKMCWVSTLDPADEEPDPFEAMWGEDEDDQAGGTIRLSQLGNLVPRRYGQPSRSVAGSSRMPSEASTSSAVSWNDRSISSNAEPKENISAELEAECREAENRHREETRAWVLKSGGPETERKERQWREVDRLRKIREFTRGAELDQST